MCGELRLTFINIFPPADQKQIEAAEEAINVRLPLTFRKLYSFSNGLSLFNGDPRIHALRENDDVGSLVSASEELRGWEWPVPEEVLVFGGNGSGEPYGLWIGPHDEIRFPEPIVEIGGIFKAGCMGLCSTKLKSLLLENTVHGLIFEDQQEMLVERFGLSPEILPDADAMMSLLKTPANEEEEA